jgi:hypothetical protein
MKTILKEIFTDAWGRIEVKMVLGVPAIILGLFAGLVGILGLAKLDWVGWGGYMTFCLGLVVTTAAADSKLDASPKAGA